jgi:anti-sigma B factor antagonist
MMVNRLFPGKMKLAVARSGETTVVAVVGEIDMSSAELFMVGVREQLLCGPVVLDLSGLAFMDSAGVSALTTLAHEASDQGRSLTIRPQLPRTIEMVLELTGVLGVLPIGSKPKPAGR